MAYVGVRKEVRGHTIRQRLVLYRTDSKGSGGAKTVMTQNMVQVVLSEWKWRKKSRDSRLVCQFQGRM